MSKQNKLFSEERQKEVSDFISHRIEEIKNPQKKEALKKDPYIPIKLRLQEQEVIEQKVAQLKVVHNVLLDFNTRIKNNYITDITHQTLNCALYLLMCNALKAWEAVFILARKNFNVAMVVLLRHIQETIDLIKIFSLEGDGSERIGRWFAGKIISHGEVRRAMELFVRECPTTAGLTKEINVYQMQTYVHSILSQYPHNSYYAMLESVDIFKEDFNFDESCSAHFTKENIGYGESLMNSTIIAMQSIFNYLKDKKNYQELGKLLEDKPSGLNEEEVMDLKTRFPRL